MHLFRRDKPDFQDEKLKAIREDLYKRIDVVTKSTADASKSFDPVNELLEKGGFAGVFFLASPGGGKYMDRKAKR